MNIYLINHGDSYQGKDDLSRVLTRKGLRQVGLLGKRLEKFKIDIMYCSSMARAVQTAVLLNKHLLVDVLIRHDLREIDMGTLQDNWDVVNEFYPDFAKKFSEHIVDVPYPGGECGLDVLLRASNVMSEILDSGYENVAVVAHKGTIRVLLSGILGLEQQRRFFLGLPLEDCSISTVRFDADTNRLYVHTINDHAHLEDFEDEEPEE